MELAIQIQVVELPEDLFLAVLCAKGMSAEFSFVARYSAKLRLAGMK